MPAATSPAIGKDLANIKKGDPPVTTAPEGFTNLKNFLAKAKGQLQLAAAEAISPEKLVRLALTAGSKNPDLFKCRFETVGLSLLTAAALGIEPDGYHGHLLPYRNNKAGCMDCQFIPDYKGLVRLIYRNQKTLSVQAQAVYENDSFDYEFGTNERLVHKPTDGERGKLKAAWAMVKFHGGAHSFVVLNREDVMRRKAKSQSGNSSFSPWKDWEDMMWAKTAIKVLSKRAPLGADVERVVDYDHKVEGGLIIQTVDDVAAAAEGQLAAIDVESKPVAESSASLGDFA